jgi:hypothetical protein
MSNASWVTNLQTFRPRFEAGAGVSPAAELLYFAPGAERHAQITLACMAKFHDCPGTQAIRLAPGKGTVVVFGPGGGSLGSVAHFLGLGADAAAALPQEEHLGLGPDQFHAVWLAFVLDRLRACPGCSVAAAPESSRLITAAGGTQAKPEKVIQTQTQPEQVILGNLYAASVAAIELAAARQAEVARIAADPAPSLLPAFSPETLTVTFGGREYVLQPKTFSVFRAIVGRCPQPVTRAQLREEVAGCRGSKAIRAALNELPAALSDTVKSGHNGYHYSLAPGVKKGRGGRRKKGHT